jgi:hypothetical protein
LGGGELDRPGELIASSGCSFAATVAAFRR